MLLKIRSGKNHRKIKVNRTRGIRDKNYQVIKTKTNSSKCQSCAYTLATVENSKATEEKQAFPRENLWSELLSFPQSPEKWEQR